jgi:hypothetical protein
LKTISARKSSRQPARKQKPGYLKIIPIMTGKTIIIRFSGSNASIAPGKELPLKQLNLPELADSFPLPAWWSVTILKYFPDEKRLFVEITSYNTGVQEFSSQQLAMAQQLSGVEFISFRHIDTNGLYRTLRSDKPLIMVAPSEYSMPVYLEETGEEEKITGINPPPKPAYQPPPETPRPVREPVRQIFEENFLFPLKDVRFRHGGVALMFQPKGMNKPVELEIVNYDIREEFDAVKNYFANILKTKKIQVFARVITVDGVVTSSEARSPEIQKINRELIDSVKFEFVKGTFRKRIMADVDKSLFTMDELFDNFTNQKVKSSAFYQDDRSLLDDLLQITTTKHYRNLRYLSSRHAYRIMRIRFIIKPFSFIFLIEGEKGYHIVWETLDTAEATYVWHIQKNLDVLKRTLSKIEDIINTIKVQGKTAYINTSEDPFRRIWHDYSDLVDGFVKWKGELESILV